MQSIPGNQTSNRIGVVCAVIFLAPFLATIVVLASSPHFRSTSHDVVRASPIGSDFLQEWVGGHIVRAGQSDRLYDDQWTRQLQHDPSLLGFRWDEGEYYPMVYPPFYYWLVSPLSQLPLKSAAVIWCMLNGLAFSIGLSCLAFHLRARLGNWIWCIPFVGLFHPLLLSLNMGQKSGFLLMIFAGSFALLQRGRSFSAGVVFGMLAFKPHLALIIGPAMLLKRQFRFATGALIPVVAGLGVSILMGHEVCLGFWRVCTHAAQYADHTGYSLSDAQNIWSATRLVFQSWSSEISLAIGTILSAIVIGYLARGLRGELQLGGERFARQYSALVLATILLSAHFYTYDLSIVLVPALIIGSLLSPAGNLPTRVKVDHGFRANRTQAFIMVVFFVAAGHFTTIAEATRVPLSVGLMMLWFFLIIGDLQSQPSTRKPIQVPGKIWRGWRLRQV